MRKVQISTGGTNVLHHGTTVVHIAAGNNAVTLILPDPVLRPRAAITIKRVTGNTGAVTVRANNATVMDVRGNRGPSMSFPRTPAGFAGIPFKPTPGAWDI